jgi:hypothetical protein
MEAQGHRAEIRFPPQYSRMKHSALRQAVRSRGEAFGHHAGMDSHDLTPDQCRALAEMFGGMQQELSRVLKRMRERRFAPQDRTLQLTESAFALMQELRMHVHYIGCGQIKRPDGTDK